MADLSELRTCTHCKVIKPLTEFGASRDRYGTLRVASWCKRCAAWSGTKAGREDRARRISEHDGSRLSTPRRLTDLAWLAGLVEGEGSIALNTGRPYIKVAMIDADVIARARQVAGCGTLCVCENVGRRAMHVWQVTRLAQAPGLIMTLYPWLGSRRRHQARAALAKWRHTTYFRSNSGVSVNTAKLNPTKVLQIRELYARTEATQKELSEQYGVRQGQISRIVRGESWRPA